MLERTVALAIMMASAATCSAQVLSYEAMPSRLCAGDSTTLRWHVRGNATLTAEPSISGLPNADAVDSARVSPMLTTVFTLAIQRSSKKFYARQEVVILDPNSPRTLVDIATPLGSDSIETILRLEPRIWDTKARVITVTARSGRPLAVTHDGRRVTLTDAAASNELQGTPLSGVWIIHAPLQPGEVMGDSVHPPPDRLRLVVQFGCGSSPK